jgi:hypothetical protein
MKPGLDYSSHYTKVDRLRDEQREAGKLVMIAELSDEELAAELKMIALRYGAAHKTAVLLETAAARITGKFNG